MEKIEKMSNDYPLTVLSSLYPVFFSITLASLFMLDVVKKEIHTVADGDMFAISSLILLISYYLTDWISSTFSAATRGSEYSPAKLFLLVVGNLIFCALILATACSKSENYFHYTFIGIYLLFAPLIWHFWAMKAQDDEDDVLAKFAWAKTIFGAFLALGGSIILIPDSPIINEYKNTIILCLNILLFIVVVTRLFRLRYSYRKVK